MDTAQLLFTRWKETNDKFLKVIRQVPDECLDFKPTEKNFTIKDLLLHVAQAERAFSEGLVRGEIRFADFKAFKAPDVRTTEEIHSLLKDALENTQTLFAGLSGEELNKPVKTEWLTEPKPLYYFLIDLFEHTTHHRGQLYIYLRLRNVEPIPFYGP